ncbi:MAG TPA: cytochrome c5 family protein [Saprospirales bacterium]|nr:cytochrome c5 family protein [Saprospirales bacterium]HAY70623.1 cytochrome c5 family protein [Saprospirales bacterium]HRQ30369.1 c-type cytochrome [Saprospiraceae bacterium]
MKKAFGLFLLMAVFVFALISCGGEKKEKETPEATIEAQVEEVAATTTHAPETIALYDKYCTVCHKEGIAGAPKIGDATLWGPRAEKGMATLVKHVTEGYTGETGIMPAKGTCMECTEDNYKNLITYMLDQAGLKAN